MTRRFFLTVAATVLVGCLYAGTAQSYGAYPVIEVGPNLAVNTLTSQLMGIQVWNSTQEVEMMRQNLLRGGGSYDDILGLLKRLDETIREGDSIDYQIENLKRVMGARFPGYKNPGRWSPQYDLWTRTLLDTLRGALGAVHEGFKPVERLREIAITQDLRQRILGANGNLDVSQALGLIQLQTIEEGRKNRQLAGMALNVQAVALSNDANREAASAKIFSDWIERSQVEVKPYSGQGGFGPESFGR